MDYDLRELEEMSIHGDDWTRANQAKLYMWKGECLDYAQLHMGGVSVQKKIFMLLKSAATLAAVTTATLIAFSEKYPGIGFSDAAIVTSAIVSILSGVDFLLSPQERYMGHKQAMDSYNNVARTIDYFCSLHPKKRPDVEVAYTIVNNEMYNIDTRSPAIMKPPVHPNFPDLKASHSES